MDKDNITNFKKIIADSQRILVVSHNTPDPDAISSTSFTYNILKHNYPNKEIVANFENPLLKGFDTLFDTNILGAKSFDQVVDEFKPELVVVLDFGSPILVSREEMTQTYNWIKENSKLVIIDHHKLNEFTDFDIYFNENDDACVLTAYKIFVEEMQLETYDKYADTALLGILGDTGHFSYLKNDPKELFSIVSKLVKDGGNIDRVSQAFGRISLVQAEIFQEYFKNLKSTGEYSFSYISDNFFKSKPEITEAEYTATNKLFIARYIKAVENAKWGFTIKPVRLNQYTVSFRSVIGEIDTTVFSRQFNGNGHKASSGASVYASSAQEAIEKVIDVIKRFKSQAYSSK